MNIYSKQFSDASILHFQNLGVAERKEREKGKVLLVGREGNHGFGWRWEAEALSPRPGGGGQLTISVNRGRRVMCVCVCTRHVALKTTAL